MNVKEIVSHFKHLLSDKGINETFNYPQVMGKMKKIEPLFSDLKNFEIKLVCEVIIREYGNGKIKSDVIRYPLNIHVLTRKWVVEKAIKIMKEELEAERQERKAIVEENTVAEKRNKVAITSILERIKEKREEAE